METSRIVVLTGASMGLGRVMTLALLEAGHRVTAVARTAEAMHGLVMAASKRGWAERLLPARCDVTSAEMCEAIVTTTQQHFGGIDALVNNAGANVPARVRPRFYEVSVEEWQLVIDTNLNSAFRLARLVAPLLVDRGWGRIVNQVTSFPTMTRGGYTPYGPSKAALEAATVAWAAELRDTGVTVNAILPGGAADTRRLSREEAPDRSRLVNPMVMAAPIRWLLSDASSGVTGMRVEARHWSPEASDEDNVATALHPAWSGR